MNLSRRHLLQLAASAALVPATTLPVLAQSYPSRSVRWVVPFPAGGVTDIVARLIGQRLSERLGQPFVIENRAGAGGSIGTESVVRAPADGHTLLLAGAFNTINSAIYDKLAFDFSRDIAPVAGLIRTYYVVVVHPSVPAQTLAELITYAKANAGKLNMASGGNGTPQHVNGEMFKMLTGVQMAHVPYRGVAPALNDLVAGHVQFMVDNLTTSLPHIRDGKLRALAVTSADRSLLLPDVPSVTEVLPGFQATGWLGMAAPKGTPAEIISLLNREVNACLAEPAISAKLADLGGSPMSMHPAEFGKLIGDETTKWSKVVAFAGIKSD